MAYIGPVYRWDVFWADLTPHVGQEQAGDCRPVLIVSNDAANKRFSVVTMVPLAKLEGKDREPHSFEVQLPGDPIGNGWTSLALPHQIRTISKMRLLEKTKSLDDEDARFEVENKLLAHLGIHLDE